MWLIAGALGGIPTLCFVVLLSLGFVSPVPGLIALATILIATITLALFLRRDEHLLLAQFSEPRTGKTGRRTTNPAPLFLAELAGELQRRGRMNSEQLAELDQLRRADEAILERLPDPLILLNAAGAVVRSNTITRATFGTELPAVMRHPSLRVAIDRALASAPPVPPIVVDLALPVPVVRELAATIIALPEPGPREERLILVLSDRTRERAIERMRADFVANASHELRTPLASLISFIETLRGPAAEDRPAQIRFLAIMAEQAERMNRLIDDLLSLSRIELTEHQPPHEAVDLNTLLPRVLAAFEPRVAARSVTLEAVIASGLPPIAGDADQLTQVFSNLLDNALKYGRERGRVQVMASLATDNKWPARPGVVISVTDDGPGIAREHLTRLTERFYRVDKGRSRSLGGTGLGLAIVKHIVNRHRGQLLIESEVGQGARFSVWLPLQT